MATDDLESGDPRPDTERVTISGNTNSGVIAGRDVGAVHLGKPELPPAQPPAAMPAAPAAAKPGVLRILCLGANPDGAPALRLTQEVRDIDQALRQAEFRDRFELHQQLAVRPGDLQGALLRHRPHILQFSGHGTVDGIFLEDEAGHMTKAQGEVIARILGVFRNQLRCVVLNACYSRDQAESIAKYIDCVVGMSTAIGDRAATRFAVSFYQALAFGSSVEMAFQLACAQIDLDGLGESRTPQLIAFRQNPGEIYFVKDGP